MADHQLKFNYKINISSITLSELKNWINKRQHIEESFIKELKNNSRKGTAKLDEKCIRKNRKLKEEEKRIESIKEIEKDLHNKGYKYIAGVDEAGKGALAGPVTAAVIFYLKEFTFWELMIPRNCPSTNVKIYMPG